MENYIFTGRLTADATLKTVGNKNVLNFDVAHDITVKGERKTKFIRCAIWGDNATKVMQYLTKGKAVLVEGVPNATAYINKEGKAVAQIEVMVNRWEFTYGSPREENAPAKPVEAPNYDAAVEPVTADTLPF